MRGEYNGLKAQVLKENESAHYVHCFAHQLQLALVGVASKHVLVAGLFELIYDIVNAVGASSKRQDTLLESQVTRIIDGLENDEIVSKRGLNQETTLTRPGDTRWGSHYNTLNNLITLFDYVVDVLDEIMDEAIYNKQSVLATRLLEATQSFEFVIVLHLMQSLLGITNQLSIALQRKDQDIENAMRLVALSKKSLRSMRDGGWSSLLDKAYTFCVKRKIHVLIMDDMYEALGRSRRNFKVQGITNFHHYHVEVFNTVIDMQLQELNHRFNETNTELLLCIACLSPLNSFASFNRQKLIRLTEFYPRDFSNVDVLELSDQFDIFIQDVHSDTIFSELKSISNVARVMVETRMDMVYPLVYKLLTLALILPVATTIVERSFSAMKYVKNRLRNKMGDQFLNN